MSIFTAPSQDETARQLADHLPTGRLWARKHREGSKINGLIRGCATAFNRVQQQIETLANEFHVPLSVDLLPEWEASVGLPDECLRDLETLAERREAVIQRLRKVPIVTREEYRTLLEELTGLEIRVIPGAQIEVFPLEFPITFSGTSARFKLYIEFPEKRTGFRYDFPVPFGGFRSDIAECVLKRISPSNVFIYFR
ncbi:MAG: putative phage tail protein [Pseudomonadota bacterium]